MMESNLITTNKVDSPSSIIKPSSGAIPSILRPAVAANVRPPAFEPRIYQIKVRGDRFEPDNLKIEKGSIVEWRVISDEHDSLDDETSTISMVYSASTRSHVIAFESPQLAHTESNLLRASGENNSFKVKFLEAGHYPYRCQIFPRLRGSVSVFDNIHQIL